MKTLGERLGRDPRQVHRPLSIQDVHARHCWLDLHRGTVTYRGQTKQLPATASVDAATGWSRRGQSYLTIQGDGWSLVINIGPREQQKARAFAATVNTTRSRP